ILSGLATRFVVDALGFAWTFLGVGVLLVAADLLLRRLGAFIQTHELPTPTVTPTGSAVAGDSWSRLPMATRHFSLLLIGFSFLAIFGRMLMDFLYNSQMAAAFPSASELAGFLGLFWAAIDVISLLLQTLAGSWVFANLRLGTVMSVRAGAMTLIALIGAWYPGPATAAAGWLALMTLTKAFVNPGFVIMLEPIPKHSRVMIRRYISIADASANMAAGALLLFLKAGGGRGSEAFLFLLVAVLFGIPLLAARLLDRWYAQTVEETLQQIDAEGDIEIIHALRFVAPVERQSRMARLLQHQDPEVRFQTILETAELPPEPMADLLLTALVNEKEPRNIAAMVRTILLRLGPMGEE
ncbi:MAG TPA: hypothetical protein PKO06_24735, partial [Candidatus Ozemobacteraceae bacterium]|nr:hypothetical protein [Candidatus Ozemobacteraceae bacterium]